MPVSVSAAAHRHEQHYVDMSDHLVQSDKLFGKAGNVEEFVGKSKVILCTVSMLSHPAMDTVGVFRRVPVERLVVDEASQIDMFEFMVREAGVMELLC